MRTALEMIDLVELFNAEREVAGKPPIRIGVGVASGEMVAGYTGTQDRATYTCIGETVNLAARLETQTKVSGRPILIDRATREGSPEASRSSHSDRSPSGESRRRLTSSRLPRLLAESKARPQSGSCKQLE